MSKELRVCLLSMTVPRNKMVKKAEELFKMADVNGDGHLTIEEFTALMEQAKQKYPQVQVLFSKAEHMQCEK